MTALGEVALWACVAIGWFVGGMLFFFSDDTEVRARGVFVLAGMVLLGLVLLGLVLRRVFGGSED